MKLITATHKKQPASRFPAVWLDNGMALNLPKAIRILAGRQAVPFTIDMFDSLINIISLGQPGMAALRALLADIQSNAYNEAMIPQGDIALLAPIPRPAKNIFCVGRNYLDHIAEGYTAQKMEIKLPEHIQLFSKPPTTVIGPNGQIEYESTITKKLDYEIELGVIIGKGGRNIPERDALEHIFGYTIINDITARDLQRAHEQWFKGKGLDTSCPMGPWIVTQDEIADPQSLHLTLKVNDEVRQNASTSQMIFKLPAIISTLSQGLTLEPGDVIATGTPSGVGYAMSPPRFLQSGDVVHCEIEGIGTMANSVSEGYTSQAFQP